MISFQTVFISKSYQNHGERNKQTSEIESIFVYISSFADVSTTTVIHVNSLINYGPRRNVSLKLNLFSTKIHSLIIIKDKELFDVTETGSSIYTYILTNFGRDFGWKECLVTVLFRLKLKYYLSNKN